MQTKFYLEVTVSKNLMEKGFKVTESMLNSIGEVIVPEADVDEIVVRLIQSTTLKTRLENLVKTIETAAQALKGLTGD